MMNRIMKLQLLTVLVFLALAACDNKKGTGPEDTGDTITIDSVNPESGITPNVSTNFTVIVSYELVSEDSGELMIGFNSAEAGRFAMISQATFLVDRGSGGHQFNVSVVPIDWGDDGDFQVYVNLSEHPHGMSWSPLATDVRVLGLTAMKNDGIPKPERPPRRQ